jgi:hypothetical protein
LVVVILIAGVVAVGCLQQFFSPPSCGEQIRLNGYPSPGCTDP